MRLILDEFGGNEEYADSLFFSCFQTILSLPENKDKIFNSENLIIFQQNYLRISARTWRQNVFEISDKIDQISYDGELEAAVLQSAEVEVVVVLLMLCEFKSASWKPCSMLIPGELK